ASVNAATASSAQTSFNRMSSSVRVRDICNFSDVGSFAYYSFFFRKKQTFPCGIFLHKQVKKRENHAHSLDCKSLRYYNNADKKDFFFGGSTKMAQAKIYYQSDCDINVLKNKTVAIIGYGSQGHAHELNLKESGVKVVVGMCNGSKSWQKAEKAGLTVMTAEEAAKAADIIMILTPDEKQAKIYRESILPELTEGKALAFAHGFNIHFKQIVPPAN